MTIEEKARAYDEALEDMRVIYPNLKGDAKLAVEHAFPELAESEDERIRKFICSIIDNLEPKDFVDVKKMNVLAWLEKQKDFFKDGVGHYFYDGNTTYFISSPIMEERAKVEKTCKENAASFTDEDERILRNLIDAFTEYKKSGGVDFHGIEINTLLAYLEKQKEQKPTEWSEDDEKIAYFVNQFLEYHENADPTAKSCKKWFNNRLKSLRPSWKPSEEELGRKHLEGYIMGREDTMREMKDFVESHFNCENAKKGTPIVYNTQSGTATATLHGNTSTTDGKEHNPSFID